MARIFLAITVFAFSAPAARADGGGMYLCRSAIIAHALWAGFWQAQAIGSAKSALKGIAARHQCPFIRSDRLKPTDYALGQILLSDGKRSGWAATQYYAIYFGQTGPRPRNDLR